VETQRRDTAEVPQFSSWQEVLRYAKEQGGYDQILHKNGLVLLNFKATRKSVRKFMDKYIAADDVGIITLDDRTVDHNFMIDRLTGYENLCKRYNDRKREIVKAYAADRTLKVVRLKWAYQGKSYKTYALVSEKLKMLVYDDFLSNISIFSVEEYSGVVPREQ